MATSSVASVSLIREPRDEAEPESTPPIIVCVPTSDRAFCDEVRAFARSLTPLTILALEDTLRATYPAVRVRASVLSGMPLVTWYVYRDRAFPGR